MGERGSEYREVQQREDGFVCILTSEEQSESVETEGKWKHELRLG